MNRPSRNLQYGFLGVLILAGICLVLFIVVFIANIHTTSNSTENSASFSDWLIQDVCVKDGQVIAADPGANNGNGCANARATERDLQPGENFPYHKLNQEENEERDSYPIITTAGDERYITTDDYDTDGVPFGIYKWWDGLAVYGADANYIYAADTASSGFPNTFFGNSSDTAGKCTLEDGWLFFPPGFSISTNTATSGQIALPIGDSYWQQEGTNWPGSTSCGGSVASSMHYTSWEKIPSFTYGAQGKPTTSLPTIRVVHGMPVTVTPIFLQKGHLEIFYFTKQYGYTRWESWFANKADAKNSAKCTTSYGATADAAGTDSMVYDGVTFYRDACDDSTKIYLVPQSGGDPVDIMPIPEMNFLTNWSFGAGLKTWQTTGAITAQPEESKTCPDTTIGQNPGQACVSPGSSSGVKYVQLSCAVSNGSCSAGGFYQDIPLTSSKQLTSGTYAIAVQARKERGNGSLALTLSQIGAGGAVLSSSSFTANVPSSAIHYGKTYSYDPSITNSGSDSVIWASTFVSTTTPVTISPSATSLRLSISPNSPGSYDLIDAWVMKE